MANVVITKNGTALLDTSHDTDEAALKYAANMRQELTSDYVIFVWSNDVMLDRQTGAGSNTLKSFGSLHF